MLLQICQAHAGKSAGVRRTRVDTPLVARPVVKIVRYQNRHDFARKLYSIG